MTTTQGTSSLAPYLSVKDAKEAIDFYVRAFGAKKQFALIDPGDGRVGHAELELAGATIMLADEYPDFGCVSPHTLGGSPVTLHITVDDVDKVYLQAIQQGATELRPVKDQFFGDRSGALIDPFGHTWVVSTTVETVSPEEMQRRWNEAMEG